jgi:hypothetical protein
MKHPTLVRGFAVLFGPLFALSPACVPAPADSGSTPPPAASGGGNGSSGGAGGGPSSSGSGGQTGSGGNGNGSGGATEASGGSGAGSGGSQSGGSGGGDGGMTGSSGGRNGSGGAAGGGGMADAGGPSTTPGTCAPDTGKALQFSSAVEDLVKADLGADLPIMRASRTVELWAWFSGPKAWVGEHSLFEYGAGKNCNVFGIDVEKWAADAAKLDPYGNGCGSDNVVTLTPNVPQTGWLHLAWAYDGQANMFQFTVNGIAQPIPSKMATPKWNTTASPITIGAANEFGKLGFDGKIDEFRVWNVFRSEADIKRDMKVILKGTEPGLVAYYHFDEGTGTTAADATGKNHVAMMISPTKPMWVASDVPGPFTCAP